MFRKENIWKSVLFVFFFGFSLYGCMMPKKLTDIKTKQVGVTLCLPDERIDESSFRDMENFTPVVNEDTITVNIDGHDMLIMKAVRDEETGEMVATQELQAAVVTAKFRNVAERHGKIDLEFQLRVPKELTDAGWQLRFYPDMFIMEDSLRLEEVIVTGENYRKAQLKGYQQYNKFLSRIISDTTKFIDIRNLEIFLQRNIPQIYRFKTDSSYVSDVVFASCLGVTEKEAVSHYTNKFAKAMNNRRKAMRKKMYAKYVKAPIRTEHIRLDTVVRTLDGDFIYNYVETIETRKGLRKVDIFLTGEIYEQDKLMYTVPKSGPLTFYISSISTFADMSPRYLTKVIERQAEANAAWNIDFKVGKSDIDLSLGENASQIDNIKANLRHLLKNEVFDLDSITIAAFASPEGSVAANKKLSEQRSKATAEYFNRFVKQLQDSVKNEAGMSIMVGDDFEESEMASAYSVNEIKFMTSASGENWNYLTALVEESEMLSETEKEIYLKSLDIKNQDQREAQFKSLPMYRKMKEHLYPKLRKVQFNFFLHRKGMIKDTIHTTVLDTTYMKGLKMLTERDYEGALELLGPYQDYNTAIAYVSLDRNVSAMGILEKLEHTAPVNYMLAILNSRAGRDKDAVQYYLTSCKQDGSYVHRGNLDPEISALIKKYNLNAQPEDDFDFPF